MIPVSSQRTAGAPALGLGGLQNGYFAVRRVKEGAPNTHPILGDELRALRRLQREKASKSPSSLRQSGALIYDTSPRAAQSSGGALFSSLGKKNWRTTDRPAFLTSKMGVPIGRRKFGGVSV
jgi:hypothetical protein